MKKNGNWKCDDFDKMGCDEYKYALSIDAKDGYNFQFNGAPISSTMMWFDDKLPIQWDYDYFFDSFAKAKEMIFLLRVSLERMGYVKSSQHIEENKFDISYIYSKGTKKIHIFTMSPYNEGGYPLCLFVIPDNKETMAAK